jgi:hypothetical protein
MQPLVLQLQQECLDSRVSILEMLRKALVVARKLSLPDAQVWIEKELDGYKSGDAPPQYRLLKGQIRAWNPYQGWIPVIFRDSKKEVYLSKCFVGQPVGELEDLVKHGNGTLQFPFDSDNALKLMRDLDNQLHVTRHISSSAVSGIIDAVRNMVLNWTLQLEADGILGEALIFNAKEKAVAAHSNYTINYNAAVTHSQIQQGSPNAIQTMHVTEQDRKAIADFVETLKRHELDLKIDACRSEQLRIMVQKIQTEVGSTNPSGTALRETLRTLRNLLEGCASSLIASGLLFEIGKLLK